MPRCRRSPRSAARPPSTRRSSSRRRGPCTARRSPARGATPARRRSSTASRYLDVAEAATLRMLDDVERTFEGDAAALARQSAATQARRASRGGRQVLVQLDEVGALAVGETPTVRHAEQVERVARLRPRRHRSAGCPAADDVPDGAVERDHRSGQRVGAGERRPAVPRPRCRGRRSGRDPVARAGDCEGIADEQQPVARLEARDQRPERRDGRGSPSAMSSTYASSSSSAATATPGRPMVDAGHRVEQVGRRATRPRRSAFQASSTQRRRMTDRHRHALARAASR